MSEDKTTVDEFFQLLEIFKQKQPSQLFKTANIKIDKSTDEKWKYVIDILPQFDIALKSGGASVIREYSVKYLKLYIETYDSLLSKPSKDKPDYTEIEDKLQTIYGWIRSSEEHLMILTVLELKDQSLKELKEELDKSRENAKKIDEIKTKYETELKEHEEKYKDLFSKSEILLQANLFQQSGLDYRNLAQTKWSISIILVSILILSLSIVFLTKYKDNFQSILDYQLQIEGKLFEFIFYTVVISKIFLKIFILTILIYLLKFCINNYNALMHNATINIHKQNSLVASLRIIRSIEKSEIREEILSLSAKEIFVQHETGYLSKEKISNIDISLLEKVSSIFKK